VPMPADIGTATAWAGAVTAPAVASLT